ncbi:hypothetical protein FRB93_012750 [Tulasnella sp. JGI-2019a]|nr:hypothetical protein FRB93_012750 [Tulasnella sp. JGI-2019a]
METTEDNYWLGHHSVAVWDIQYSPKMIRHFTTLQLQHLLAGNVSTGAPLPALDEKVNGVKDDDDGSLPPQETEDNNRDDNLPPRAMEDDGEDDNIPALETAASPGPEIRHWMKCLALYPRALHSLETQVNIHRDRQFPSRLLSRSLRASLFNRRLFNKHFPLYRTVRALSSYAIEN